MAEDAAPPLPGRLYNRLRAEAAAEWERYVGHAFVRGMGQGTLPLDSFRHYLIQDYRFLIHFARAYALAVYKADDLADMRRAGAGMAAILDLEMGLHVTYCAGWGIDEAAMAAAPEAQANVAYTRFVLERGMAGDLLDLHVALAPCVCGYAEIGARLAADPATRREGNPYTGWIDMYAGPEYQEVARAAALHLDGLAERRGGAARFAALAGTFATATRLEAGFWDMGLHRLG